MPSFLHEALVQLFRNRPGLAPDLLRLARGPRVPPGTAVRLEDSTLSEPKPPERRADLIALLARKRRRLAVIVEIQLTRNHKKRYAWPAYVVGARARFRCPACVLVLTPHESVARWARRPIELGPGATVTPIVVGPDELPHVRDIAIARSAPDLAILSVLAHGRADPHTALEIAKATWSTLRPNDDERAMLYFDMAVAALGNAAFEELMLPPNYQFQSEFARTYFSRGKAAGVAEGTAIGKAEDILLILRTRGVSVGVTHEKRIRRCDDPAQLERWLVRALSVTAAKELFEEGPRATRAPSRSPR